METTITNGINKTYLHSRLGLFINNSKKVAKTESKSKICHWNKIKAPFAGLWTNEAAILYVRIASKVKENCVRFTKL